MLPGRILDQADPEKRLLRVAADDALCRDFSIEYLRMLAQADALERVVPDPDKQLEKIALCHQEAQRAGCLLSPGAFADDYTQRAYFKSRNEWHTQSLFNDTWGEMVLLCGLLGTEKDTWIRANKPRLPVVSLDDLRREMGVSPAEKQGSVAQAAKERARKHLRARQPFVWNATNLTEAMRGGLIALFEDYGAAADCVSGDWLAGELAAQCGTRRSGSRACHGEYAGQAGSAAALGSPGGGLALCLTRERRLRHKRIGDAVAEENRNEGGKTGFCCTSGWHGLHRTSGRR